MFAVQRVVASSALRRAVTSPAFQRFAVAAAAHCLMTAVPIARSARVAHMAHATKPVQEFVRLPVSVTFHKEDERELRSLLMKLHMQANLFDKDGYKLQMEEEREELVEIPGLNLTEEQIDALLEWKHDL